MLNLSSRNFIKKSYKQQDVLKYMYSGQVKISSICFPSRIGLVTLNPETFEDVYVPPATSEASGGSILNTNQ